MTGTHLHPCAVKRIQHTYTQATRRDDSIDLEQDYKRLFAREEVRKEVGAEAAACWLGSSLVRECKGACFSPQGLYSKKAWSETHE
jgi:hypothetical protein